MTSAGRIAGLWRYPVKSLLGERLQEVAVDARGLEGDRRHAVLGADGRLGSGKSTSRLRGMPGLLGLRARVAGDATEVIFPDGRRLRAGDTALDAALSAALGEPVTLAPAAPAPYVDAAPLHLLTTASLDWLRSALPGARIDERRFRPNLVLEVPGAAPVERGWIGRTLAAGPVRLRIVEPTERCRMVTLAQEDLDDDPLVLRAIAGAQDACFGAYAEVLEGGSLRAGDAVVFAA